jgi:hypothetical protein
VTENDVEILRSWLSPATAPGIAPTPTLAGADYLQWIEDPAGFHAAAAALLAPPAPPAGPAPTTNSRTRPRSDQQTNPRVHTDLDSG